MILVNLLDEQHKREVDPLERLRGLFALALPFFAIVVAIAAWPDKTVLVRQATLEEKETVVELLGRLPSYYERLEKISASIVDEIAFDRAELKVRVEPAPTVQFDDTSMTITEGFLSIAVGLLIAALITTALWNAGRRRYSGTGA